MTHLPFVAELHDIGKLMDVECLRTTGQMSRGQKVHNIDLNSLGVSPPVSSSWWAVWSDELGPEECFYSLNCAANLEQRALILLTKIADGTAASVSRIETKRPAMRSEGVHLLWRQGFFDCERQKGLNWAAFKTAADLREMIGYFDQCTSPSDFFKRFRDCLRLTPEDKSPPGNFMTLRVHLELSGKIFRVINQYVVLDQTNPDQPRLVYDSRPVSTLREAVGGLPGTKQEAIAGKWIFRIVKCYVRFPYSIVRLQDLNVLELRRQKIQDVVVNQDIGGNVERQAYSVLFHTDDVLCLFLPRENHLSLRHVLRPLWEKGFWIDCEELEAELNLLSSTGERTRKQLQRKYPGKAMYGGRFLKLKHIAVWPDLDPAIEPPLCDLCQQRQGQQYLKGQVREWLCQSCQEIRKMGDPASAYARWEETGFPAAWLKVSLDQKLLLSCLHRLFETHVDTGSGMDPLSASDKQALRDGWRPLAAQMEFVREYGELLQEFGRSLENLNGSAGTRLLKSGETLLFPIDGYLELAIIRLDNSKTLGAVLDLFVELLRTRFPECMEDSPIRLSVSMGNPKYPYQEHWRFFSEPQKTGVALSVQQPGLRQLNLTVDQYMALREKLASERLSHFLHRLASIEAEGGETTALFQALEQRQRFPQILELIMLHRLGLRQVLDFHRLVGSNAQYEEALRA
jgi:hypothetical protein